MFQLTVSIIIILFSSWLFLKAMLPKNFMFMFYPVFARKSNSLMAHCSVLMMSRRKYISVKDLLVDEDETDGLLENTVKTTENYPISKMVNGRYVSPWSKVTEKKARDVIRYLITSKQQKLIMKDKSDSSTMLKAVEVDKKLISSTVKPHFSWMGHASCYYQTDGVYFLTDPVFSNRASFSQYFGPKRFMPAPIELDELKVDVVLLSHTHYDHMDVGSIKTIGNKALWIVPLGVKALLSNLGVTNCVELDWWGSYHYLNPLTGGNIEIVFTPTKHWTARNLTDRNTCLWGSYVVLAQKSKFFFAGDTAYCSVFKRIGLKYGPFDLAAIPIGAYLPRWFMKDVHNNPEEAVQIHRDLCAKQSAAIHWGTFPLADEDPLEPALELARVRDVQGMPASEFTTMAHGETIEVGNASQHDLATIRTDLYEIYLDSLRDKDLASNA